LFSSRSPTKVQPSGETQFGFNEDVQQTSSPRLVPYTPGGATAGNQGKKIPTTVLKKKPTKKPEPASSLNDIYQVGSVPFTGSHQASNGNGGLSSLQFDSDYADSFHSCDGAFPSSFHNSNYPPSLGLLKTVERSSEIAAPSRMMMNFETGSYDTCSEYLTQSALTRHAETIYRKNSRASGLSLPPPPPLPPSNGYYDNETNHDTHAHLPPGISKASSNAVKYRNIQEPHNMSMELTFENSLYGLASGIASSASTTAAHCDDHMDQFEPFEFLQCDSNASPRQPPTHQHNSEQHSRFSIPLL